MYDSKSLESKETSPPAERPAERSRARALTRTLLTLHPEAVDLATLGAALVVVWALAGAPMSGDFGQWLMVSRFYAGESIPDYREPLAVAPLVPAFLGFLKTVLNDPIGALEILRMLLAFGLAAGLYAAGRAFFQARLAGLFAVVLGFGATPHVLELYAFGGLLQLAALIFLLLTLACFAAASGDVALQWRWWFAGGFTLALGMMSHTGSVVVLLPSAGLVALAVLLFTTPKVQPKQWIRFLAPAAAPPLGALVYWLIVLVPLNRGYADNPATGAYRGANILLDRFTGNQLSVAIILVGATVTVIGVGYAFGTRRSNGFVLVAAWSLASLAVVFAAVASGTPTDYPRFTALVLLPFVLATAGAGTILIRWMTDSFVRGGDTLRFNIGGVAIGGVLLVSLLLPQIDYFEREAAGYSPQDRHGIEVISGWLEHNLPRGQSVLALTPSHGKWIEGLTGIETVFSIPTRFSFRENELARSVVADTVIRSRMAMTNGTVSAKYIESAPAANGEVPREVVITANHDGEWADLLRLRDSDTFLLLIDGTTLRHRDLQAVSVERIETEDVVQVTTAWTSAPGTHLVNWVRTVSIAKDTNVVDVVDEVQSPTPVQQIIVGFGPFSGGELGRTDVAPGTTLFTFPRLGERQPLMEVRLPEGGMVTTMGSRFAVVASETTRLHTQFAAQTASRPIHELALLYPPELLAEYNVGAVLLEKGTAYPERLKRMEALGFRPEIEAGQYVLLVPWTFHGGEPDTQSAPATP